MSGTHRLFIFIYHTPTTTLVLHTALIFGASTPLHVVSEVERTPNHFSAQVPKWSSIETGGGERERAFETNVEPRKGFQGGFLGAPG